MRRTLRLERHSYVRETPVAAHPNPCALVRRVSDDDARQSRSPRRTDRRCVFFFESRACEWFDTTERLVQDLEILQLWRAYVSASQGSRTLENFGRNVAFTAAEYFEPRTEMEVLRVLTENPGETFRVVGALHSWSDAAAGRGHVLCLRHFDDVRVAEDGTSAEIGAGVSVARAVAVLRRSGLTLPTYGAAGSQTVAGAVATATHGSGHPSMSHYVSAVRVACFDAHGDPIVRTFTEGQPLRAARCAVGCMGIVLRLVVRCTTVHCIEEHTSRYETLDDVLRNAARFPLTQFYLIPWAWAWIGQRRRRIDGRPASRLAVLRYRVMRFMRQSVAVNGITWLLARVLRRPDWLRGVFRILFKRPAPISVVARSDQVLMMGHLLRYAEAELFVPSAHLHPAAELVAAALRYLGDDDAKIPPAAGKRLEAALEKLKQQLGGYVHHYPITFRRVERDDTLISMSSEGEMFAISLISFAKPGSRHFIAFDAVVELLAATLATKFGARYHWGKIFPLDAKQNVPGLAQFRTECAVPDPKREFRNDFTRRALGF